MAKIMAVLLNDIAQLEYDREKSLTDYQTTYLAKMDEKMDAGIELNGQQISNPDTNQRSQFIAANLLDAIKRSDESMSAALCSYLADRLPDLKQVKITEQNENVTIDLVFDEDYIKQVAVDMPKLH
jgi:hypothetical protein